MKFNKKYREKIIKDYLGYVPLTYTKLNLEKEQKKRDKEILIAYKLISKIIKRKFKLNKNKTKKWFKYNAPVKI